MRTPDYTARLDKLQRTNLSGLFARQTGSCAPLARPPAFVRADDRWQTAGDPSCLFLCDSDEAAWAERRRVTARHAVTEEDAAVYDAEAEYRFGHVAVHLTVVVDLTLQAERTALGIRVSDLVGDDHIVTRHLLAAARRLRLDGLVAPSAALAGAKTIIVLPHAVDLVVVHDEVLGPPPWAAR